MQQLTSIARRSAVMIVLTIASCWADPNARAQNPARSTSPEFPIPRAEQEFDALIPGLQDYCQHITSGDPKAFFVALSAYGPLDLEVRNAQTPQEASELRLFHVGIAAGASKLPIALAKRIGTPFQHSASDIETRKQRLVDELPQIESFVNQFRSTPQITLIAHWGFKNEYRVNDMFYMIDQTKEAIPSPVMGFVPSDQWRDYTSPQQYLDTIHVTKTTFDALNGALQSLLVAAARHDQNGDIEVIALGLANNTSGLLFLHGGGDAPAVGQTLPNGSKYSVVERVKPGVYYVETV